MMNNRIAIHGGRAEESIRATLGIDGTWPYSETRLNRIYVILDGGTRRSRSAITVLRSISTRLARAGDDLIAMSTRIQPGGIRGLSSSTSVVPSQMIQKGTLVDHLVHILVMLIIDSRSPPPRSDLLRTWISRTPEKSDLWKMLRRAVIEDAYSGSADISSQIDGLESGSNSWRPPMTLVFENCSRRD